VLDLLRLRRLLNVWNSSYVKERILCHWNLRGWLQLFLFIVAPVFTFAVFYLHVSRKMECLRGQFWGDIVHSAPAVLKVYTWDIWRNSSLPVDECLVLCSLWRYKGIKVKSQMCTCIFDCPILGPTQHCYNICQWNGGSLQYQTHCIIVFPSRKELFLKWTGFQSVVNYSHRL
jgi:hypothetical protein